MVRLPRLRIGFGERGAFREAKTTGDNLLRLAAVVTEVGDQPSRRPAARRSSRRGWYEASLGELIGPPVAEVADRSLNWRNVYSVGCVKASARPDNLWHPCQQRPTKLVGVVGWRTIDRWQVRATIQCLVRM